SASRISRYFASRAASSSERTASARAWPSRSPTPPCACSPGGPSESLPSATRDVNSGRATIPIATASSTSVSTTTSGLILGSGARQALCGAAACAYAHASANRARRRPQGDRAPAKHDGAAYPDPHDQRRDNQVELGRRGRLEIFPLQYRQGDHALVGSHEGDRLVGDRHDLL